MNLSTAITTRDTNNIKHWADTIAAKLNSQNEILSKINDSIINSAKPHKLFDLFSYDTAFTVGVTLTIFVLGIVINNFIKRFETIKKKHELKVYFKSYVDKIIDPTCTKLSNLYKKTYQNISIDTGITITPPKLLTGDFKRISNIDDMQLFNAIKEKEALAVILSRIDYVERIINEVDVYHQHALKRNDELASTMETQINKYFHQLAEYVEHIRVDNPSYHNRDNFRDLVNNSIALYHANKEMKERVRVTYRKIIRPIQKAVIETQVFRNDPVALEIAKQGREISYNYLKQQLIQFKLQYRTFYGYVNESKKKLEEEKEKIKWL